MGEEEKRGKPKKPEIVSTFVLKPDETLPLGSKFADFTGEPSILPSERPIPEEIKRTDEERAKEAPKTAEAHYMRARKQWEGGQDWLKRAEKIRKSGGNSADVDNALQKANASAINATDALWEAKKLNEQLSGLSETDRLLNKLRANIASFHSSGRK